MSVSHEVARHWRLKQQRYALVGEVCPHCDQKIFPPGGVGDCCGSDSDSLYELEVVNAEEVPAVSILELLSE